MTGFGKAVLSAILASVVLVAGDALADTQNFDLDAIEVQETNGQAIIAMDVPEGSEIKAIDNPQRGEMTVTFTGVSLRLPKRVHSGSSGDALSSVDVEPWFIDGQRVTRMVIRYPEGAEAHQEREGDLLMVTVDAPAGESQELATNASETMADEPADATPVDAETADAEMADAEMADAEMADAETADAETADAEVADAEVADAEVADAEVADAEVAEMADAETPTDTAVRETGTEPETTVVSNTPREA